MEESKYKTLAEFKAAIDAGLHPNHLITVDNDNIVATDAEYDSEGDWIEPEGYVYLYQSESPREALHEAYALLGIKSEDC